MIILKSYYDKIKNNNYYEAKEALNKYISYLEDKGWEEDIIEGGYISPDHSTIFIDNRDPYKGQLLQFSLDSEKFQNTINNLKEDFIKI